MDRQTFLALATSSQWLLFIAMSLIIYSWIERKKMIQQAGQLLFVILGIFALWVIFSGQIMVPKVSPDNAAPVEARLLTYFSGLVFTAFLGLAGFVLGFVKARWVNALNLIVVPVSLFLFFMVYELMKQ